MEDGDEDDGETGMRNEDSAGGDDDGNDPDRKK
jgi:hypothetical protein